MLERLPMKASYLDVENNLGHERSQGHEQLDVSHQPLDGLLEQLLLETNWVVSYLRLRNLQVEAQISTPQVALSMQYTAVDSRQ